MVTRQNPPEMDATCTKEKLQALLESRTHEVTELRQRIRDLELQGTEFLSAASHAVMNPLTIIQSYLEILLSDLQGGLSDQQVEFVKTAHSATLRMNRLVDSIVELAALETGAAELEMCSVDIANLVSDVCASHAALAGDRGVDLSLSITPSLPPASADVERLKNAVEAVILNAVQWTPDGGRVLIEVSPRDDGIVVGVTDTGPGIPEDQLGRVFDPFVRLSRQTSDPQRGPGLGLSIAQRQIEAMNGRIAVTSAVGTGSSFELWIPVEDEDRT